MRDNKYIKVCVCMCVQAAIMMVEICGETE